MRIGIVGPENSIQRVVKVVEENGIFLDCEAMPYETLSEVSKLMAAGQRKVDGILFTGQTPFKYASNLINPTVPWEYLPRNMISTLCALLKAGYMDHYDITRVSTDGYDIHTLQKVYEEIGLSPEEITVYCCEVSVLARNYYQKVTHFHRDLFRQGKVDLCITGLTDVHRLLSEAGIPAVKVNANAEIIVQQINKLQLIHQTAIAEEGRIAVMLIHVEYFLEHSVYAKTDLQMMQMENKTDESVCLFAQRIGAAVLKNSSGVYYVFTTKSIIESETNGFKRLELLHAVTAANGSVSSVSAGIGLGINAAEAKRNAQIGRKRAQRDRDHVNSCFVVYGDNRVEGPILSSTGQKQSTLIDKNLYRISSKTGVGINTLYQLEQVIKRYNIDTVTPAELARMSGLPHRSMNRLLTKLEDGGYVSVVGKLPTTGAGRPSRVIRINLVDRES